MFGVVLGTVFSVVLFCLMGKDVRAVNQHKQKIQAEKKKKEQAEKQQLEKIEKMKNDPQIKKKMQENEKRMRQKLFKGMSEEDKNLMEDYLKQNRKKGKNDSEIIKQATSKAGLFVLVMFIIMTFLIFFLTILITGGDHLDKIDVPSMQSIKFEALKALSVVYPRLNPGDISASVSPQSQTNQL